MAKVQWLNIYHELKIFLDTYDKRRKFKFNDEALSKKFNEMFDEFRIQFIKWRINDDLSKMDQWIKVFKDWTDKVSQIYGFKGVLYPREFRSFLENPERHLMKKIFNYSYDLLRGKDTLKSFKKTAGSAIVTSVRTNLRSIYQYWGFITILYHIRDQGFARIIYPEHGHLLLDRAGKQKIHSIPPNVVLSTHKGLLSFYLEAPRPIAWGDTGDLMKIWSLYTALRPDLMVYSGEVFNIVSPSTDPPIRRPEVIIEFKELDDWYVRAREVKGPLAKPLTAEEWRSKWIEGLWTGLAESLGVQRKENIEKTSDKGIRLSEVESVILYKRVYLPKKMYLISKARLPGKIKNILANENIDVIDDVGFNITKIKQLSIELLNYAKGETPLEQLHQLIKDIEPYIKIEDLNQLTVKFAIEKINEFKIFIKNQRNIT
ncbi:MAG: hypothetical protein ACP5GU_09430 [Thermoprotei archaeon]|jgi:hypothetical protein